MLLRENNVGVCMHSWNRPFLGKNQFYIVWYIVGMGHDYRIFEYSILL